MNADYKNCDCSSWGSELSQEEIKTTMGMPFSFCPWCGHSLKVAADVKPPTGPLLRRQVRRKGVRIGGKQYYHKGFYGLSGFEVYCSEPKDGKVEVYRNCVGQTRIGTATVLNMER